MESLVRVFGGFVQFAKYIAILGCINLFGQTYKTSFESQRFDRSKAPSVHYENGVSVDAASGRVDINIPIGPGLGDRGIKYYPRLIGTKQKRKSYYPLYQNGYVYQGTSEETQPGSAEFWNGGTFRLWGPALIYGDRHELQASSYRLPDGLEGSLSEFKKSALNVTKTELANILEDFNFDRNLEISERPSISYEQPASTGIPWVLYGGSGEIVFAIGGPASISPVNCRNQGLYYYPNTILMLKNDILYVFQHCLNNYDSVYADPNVCTASGGYVSTLMYTEYALREIKNRYNDSLKFVDCNYLNSNATPGFNGFISGRVDWYSNGVKTNKYIDFETTVEVVDEGDLTSPTANKTETRKWIKYSLDGIESKYEYGFENGLALISDAYTGEQIKANASEVITNGKKLQFYVSEIATRPNAANGINWGGYSQIFYPDRSSVLHLDKIESVTRSVETDVLTGVSRETKYDRVVPVPSKSRCGWNSTDFYVAVTDPSGQIKVYKYVEPLNNEKSNGPSDGPGNEDLQIQTLCHLKHLVREVREYASGADWRSDLGTSASSSTAYKITSYDRFDVRKFGNTSGSLALDSVPYPTRTRIWDRDRGVLEVKEITCWDSVNFKWKQEHYNVIETTSPDMSTEWRSLEYRMASDSYTRPAGSVSGYTIFRTYECDRSHWQFGRLKTEFKRIYADMTPGTCEPTGRDLPKTTMAYETNSAFTRPVSVAVGASNSLVTTNFAYCGNAGMLASQLSAVSVSGSSDLVVPEGGVGVTKYEYDSMYGHLKAIQPRGVSWTVKSDVNGFGKPKFITDANGVTTEYEYDTAGRITKIAISGQAPTLYSYDSDLLGVIESQGGRKTHYRYNGFGQLVLVRRYGKNNIINHKVFGYYADGKQKFETVWLSGAGSDSDWNGSIGSYTSSSFVYDGRGRLRLTTNPNGMKTEVVYSGRMKNLIVGSGTNAAVTTSYLHDALGRLIQVTDANGNITKYAYDAAGQVGRVSQYGIGQTTFQSRTWGYHPMGWLKDMNHPETGTTQYGQFTVSGKPCSIAYMGDGQGGSGAKTLSATYDSLSRLKTMRSGDGTVDQEFGYDAHPYGGKGLEYFGAANGKLAYSRDKRVEQFYTYSSQTADLVAMNTRVWPTGLVGSGTPWDFPQAFEYNEYGMRSRHDYGHSIVNYKIDAASGLYESASRNGGVAVTAEYDDASWSVSSLRFGNGAKTVMSYGNDQERFSAITHYGSDSVVDTKYNYIYDDLGRLKSDGEDEYSYDRLGRLVEAKIKRYDVSSGKPNAQILTQAYEYDVFGNLVKCLATGVLPQSGSEFVVNNFEFNAVERGNLAQRNRLQTTASGVPTGITYDAFGNILTYSTMATSNANDLVTFEYDASSKVIGMRTKSKPGYAEKYYYTANGLRTLIEELLDGVVIARRVNIYDDARKLVSQYQSRQQKTIMASRKSISLVDVPVRDECFASIISPVSGSVFTRGQAINFVGSTENGSTLKWNFGDRTTATGRMASKTYTQSGSYLVTFTASRSGFETSTAEMRITIQDPAPEIPKITSFVTSKALLQAGQTATLSWSVTGATSVAINGTPVSGNSLDVVPSMTTTYTLVATNSAGSASRSLLITLPPVITNFKIDPEVISAGMSATVAWVTRDATAVQLDGSVVALVGSCTVAPTPGQHYVLVASNAAGATTRELIVPNLSDPSDVQWVRDILYLGSREVAEFDSSGMHSIHSDHLGTPRIVRDSNGTAEVRQKYLPFGGILDKWGSKTIGKGYTGHESSELNSSIYMQGRFFLPTWGKFASADPALDQNFEDPQSWNLYTYVRNIPTMGTDPTGMLSFIKEKEEDKIREQLSRADSCRIVDQKTPGKISDGPISEKDLTVEVNRVGREALKEANPISIKENREYGGVIYQAKSGEVEFTKPVPGTDQHFEYKQAISLIPEGAKILGGYHCHGDYSIKGPDGRAVRTDDPKKDQFNSDHFSPPDKSVHIIANQKFPGWQSYLGTPSGKFLVLNSGTTKERDL